MANEAAEVDAMFRFRSLDITDDAALIQHATGLLQPYRKEVMIKNKQDEFNQMIAGIYKGYFKLPYHNFGHAVEVADFMSNMLLKNPLEFMTPEMNFVAILACLCHDFQHVGIDNNTLGTHLSETNFRQVVLEEAGEDASILESHHWMNGLECCLSSGCLKQNVVDMMRVWFPTLILATDLAKGGAYHDEIVKAKLEDVDANGVPIILKLYIMISDLGNVFRAAPQDYTSVVNVEVAVQKHIVAKKLKPEGNGDAGALFNFFNSVLPKLENDPPVGAVGDVKNFANRFVGPLVTLLVAKNPGLGGFLEGEFGNRFA